MRFLARAGDESIDGRHGISVGSGSRTRYSRLRKVARADEWGGLESRCGLRVTKGSNPLPSAITMARPQMGCSMAPFRISKVDGEFDERVEDASSRPLPWMNRSTLSPEGNACQSLWNIEVESTELSDGQGEVGEVDVLVGVKVEHFAAGGEGNGHL